MSNEVRIDKILLKIGNKRVELSVSEAKKLKNLLDEMYGTVVVERHDHWHWRPYVPHWDTFHYSGTSGLQLASNSGQLSCDNDGRMTMCVA